MNKKLKIGSLTLLSVALLASCATTQESKEAVDTSGVFTVEKRTTQLLEPVNYTPMKAEIDATQNNQSVVTYAKRIVNEDSTMLKTSDVYNVGSKELSSWQFASDEGGADYEQSAPNPLTYLTTGLTSDLLTQVQRGIEVFNLDVSDVKVETKIDYRYENIMTPNWKGYTDKVTTNILIDSNESPETIALLKDYAIKAWASGEGFANKTPVNVILTKDSDYIQGETSVEGSVPTGLSKDGDFTLTDKTTLPELETIIPGEDMGMLAMDPSTPVIFSVVAVAESANDSERPYMNKINARAIQVNYSGWTFYADDSYGYDGLDKAPTSWDYVTNGTSLCLMSQLSIHQMMNPAIDDYKISHNFDYKQDNFMTSNMVGHIDNITTSATINTKASDEEAQNFLYSSLACCFAGEALNGETEMDTQIYLNGSIVK
jgi:uncharacterized OsmC-like protein